MRFEWDVAKERINRAKHGFGFEIGEEVFRDPLLTSKPDSYEHGEERWKTLGAVEGAVVFMVVHTYREHDDDVVIRIISVRKATKHERREYERGAYSQDS